jgi:two-component system cell cycle sensor histidine kinase/response regulator CckA
MSKESGVTLLLIEDNDKIREVYKDILEMRGYRVIDAVNGEDAVEKFREHKEEITLLITDVMMPIKDGRETYEEIRKIKGDIKVIFTSGFDSELNRLLKKEGHYYLQKPFAPHQLLQKIVEVLDDNGS